MRVISFDCAIKTFAYVILDIKNADKLSKTLQSAPFEPLDLKKNLTLVEYKMIDILDGALVKNSTIIERTKKLYEIISDEKFIKCDLIIIEQQPRKINAGSSTICDQLLFYFIEQKKETVTINPIKKNKIYFGGNDELQHKTFLKKYSRRYTANKNHTKANFKYYLSCLGLPVPKSKCDDVADAFMESLAFFYEYYEVLLEEQKLKMLI